MVLVYWGVGREFGSTAVFAVVVVGAGAGSSVLCMVLGYRTCADAVVVGADTGSRVLRMAF